MQSSISCICSLSSSPQTHPHFFALLWQIPARVLGAPVLQYGNPKEMRVQGGSWNLIKCK